MMRGVKFHADILSKFIPPNTNELSETAKLVYNFLQNTNARTQLRWQT